MDRPSAYTADKLNSSGTTKGSSQKCPPQTCVVAPLSGGFSSGASPAGSGCLTGPEPLTRRMKGKCTASLSLATVSSVVDGPPGLFATQCGPQHGHIPRPCSPASLWISSFLVSDDNGGPLVAPSPVPRSGSSLNHRPLCDPLVDGPLVLEVDTSDLMDCGFH